MIALFFLKEAQYFKSSLPKNQFLLWRKQIWNPPSSTSQTSTNLNKSSPLQKLASVPGAIVNTFTPSIISRNLFNSPQSSPSPIVQQSLIPPPLVAISCFPDRLVCIHADFMVTILHLHEDSLSDVDIKTSFQTIIPSAHLAACFSTRSRDVGLIGTVFGNSWRVASKDFAITQGGHLLISSKFFDNSLRTFKIADGIETKVVAHHSRIQCIAQDGRYLISGDIDGGLVLWKIGGPHDSREEMLTVLFGEEKFEGKVITVERYLFGHLSGITALAISDSLKIICTGGSDGLLLLHSLEEKDSISNLQALNSKLTSIDLISIATGSGTIIVFSQESLLLASFNINGKLLRYENSVETINFIHVIGFHQQDLFITGGDRSGDICIRRCYDLQLVHKIVYLKRYRGVRCCSSNGKYILFGCVDGSIAIIGCDDFKYIGNRAIIL
jgi:WD40 repeat protein